MSVVKLKIEKNNIDICIRIQDPGEFLVKNTKYVFNEISNTYRVLFHLSDINDKYINTINNDQLKLHIPMKKNGNNIVVVIDVDLRKKNQNTDIIECVSYTKIN